jgi:hypothetical protein
METTEAEPKRIWSVSQRKEFKKLLVSATRFYTHAQIADQLDVERWQIRNWIYRNIPPSFAAKRLSPKLQSLTERAKNKQTNKNQK